MSTPKVLSRTIKQTAETACLGVSFLLLLAGAGLVFASAVPDPTATLARAEELLSRGEYKKGLSLLKPLQTVDALPAVQAAQMHLLLASAFVQTGQYEEGLRSAARCEKLALAAGQPEIMARLESVRASYWGNRGYSVRLLEHAKKSLEWAQKAGNRGLMAEAYRKMFAAYQNWDWSRALYYAQLQFEVNPNPTDKDRLEFLQQSGIAYFEVHERRLAEERLLEALELARSMDDLRSVSGALMELGFLYHRLDRNFQKALDYYEQALTLARKLGVPVMEVAVMTNLGAALRDAGKYPAALRWFQAGLRLEEKIQSHFNRSYLLKNTGQVLARVGRINEAEKSLLLAVEEADRFNPSVQWQARMELGLLYASTRPALADRYFSECLNLLEGVHANVLLENFRAGALRRLLSNFDPYGSYVDFLLRHNQASKAFYTAERARARTFLDILSAAREQVSALVSPRYVEAENELLQKISSKQSLLRNGQNLTSRELRDLTAAVEKHEAELAALRLKLQIENPALAQARYPRLYTPEELQSRVIRPGEALLMFFLGTSRSVCWVVQPKKLELFYLPGRDKVEAAIRAYVRELQTPGNKGEAKTVIPGIAGAATDDRSNWDDSNSLSRIVREITRRVPSGSRLIVVPHGALCYLPFEALRDGNGRYLIEKYSISYAPSASSYAYLRLRPVRAPEDSDYVLAVGNPVARPGPSAGVRRVAVQWLNSLKPLQYAEEELEAIGRLFRGRSRILQKQQAAEPVLDALDLKHARVVHFATHGLIDEEKPERSGVALTPVLPASDGILQTREVYRLPLQASLVTLSACQTALGREITGEGIIGLSRAFFYAGANSVMASLWSINDAATARYMIRFYSELKQGKSIDEAARQAKVHFLGDSRLSHPYYWAPFIVMGDASIPVPIRPTGTLDSVVSSWWAMAVVLTAALLLVPAIYLAARTVRARR